MSDYIAKFNKNWLIWARESVHYDKELVASKMNVGVETLNKWEETGRMPNTALKEISNIYRVPYGVFFSSKDPVYEKDLADFRLINYRRPKLTPEICFEIREAKRKRKIMLDIEDDSFFEIKRYKFKDYSYLNDEDIIIFLIKTLDLFDDKMCTYKLSDWIEKFEDFGILIFQFNDINPKLLEGYAIYYDKLPIIGVNQNLSENKKKFILFKELSHLLFKEGCLSNFTHMNHSLVTKDVMDLFENKDLVENAENEYLLEKDFFSELSLRNYILIHEGFCNFIANLLLLPIDDFKLKIKNKNQKDFYNEDFINSLARHFNVDDSLIVENLISLELIPDIDYEEYLKNPNREKYSKNQNISSFSNESHVETKNQNISNLDDNKSNSGNDANEELSSSKDAVVPYIISNVNNIKVFKKEIPLILEEDLSNQDLKEIQEKKDLESAKEYIIQEGKYYLSSLIHALDIGLYTDLEIARILKTRINVVHYISWILHGSKKS